MDADAGAVESSARQYLTAAEHGDVTALWSLMSRGAQAICVATAKAEGLVAEDGPRALEQIMALQDYAPPGSSDVELDVVCVDGDVAQVRVSSPSRGEWDPLPFVLEDGAWKVGVKGLHGSQP